MQSRDIRSRFLTFFEKRGHAIVPSASLVPENDPTVLFTMAGMMPMVPYLTGQKHPQGTRVVDVQKCIRTQDIDEVGDKTHDTFFEMLGNWSFGDYFKKDAIQWSYEFLTSKSEGLGLDPKRLYITVFEGDEKVPKDEEAFNAWKKAGVAENHIYFMDVSTNWWPAVKERDTWTGPTGSCSEMFYDITEKGLGDLTREQFIQADEKQQVVEIWNDVFMEYEKREGKIVGTLAKKNVDTGAGLERLCVVMQKKDNIFATDLFVPIMNKIDEFTTVQNERARRIVADHVRTAVFIIADGVLPSNTDRGYILRRLIRRAVRYADMLEIKHGALMWIAETIIESYSDVYTNVSEKADLIKSEIDKEELKFRKTLRDGMKEFERMVKKDMQVEQKPLTSISGKEAFLLFSSFGFPLEMTIELAKEHGAKVDVEQFEIEFKKHQELSRTAAEKKFKGGLADTSDMSLKYHTATHLLNAALRQVLGPQVMQKGSNITAERLRFDFNHSAKLTDEEKKRVEDLVNKKIAEALPVTFTEMKPEEARAAGAIGVFGEKYGDIVKVYRIGSPNEGYFSQEFCGGPHVSNTSELGHFKIQKEEAVSSGVRRIKAVLE